MAYKYNPRCHNLYYRSWSWIKSVCSNDNHPSYRNYGARGITTYWDDKYDYDDFLNWVMNKLGPRPDGMVLGRKDKTGNFEPGNLQWETPERRGRNSPGQNITATYRNKKQSLAQWSDDLDIPYYTLRRRYKEGQTLKEIVKDYKC